MTKLLAAAVGLLFAALVSLPRAEAAGAPAFPPVHPFAAPSPWPLGFNGPFAQQSTPFPGPRPGERLIVDFVGRDARAPLPSGLCYSAPYAPGVYTTYGTNAREIYKIVRTPTTLAKADFRVERAFRLGEGLQFTSGYWLPDGAQGAYFIIASDLVHLTDATPGDPSSPIAEAKRLSLAPAFIDRRSRARRLVKSDFALGLQRLYSGAIALTTERGALCAVGADLAPESLVCIDTLADAPEGAGIRNSIAAEPGPQGTDDIYITSSAAVMKVRYDPKARQFRQVWTAPLADSGSTPTLLGVEPGEDKLVLVTTFPEKGSGAPYELIALWREDRSPGPRIAGRIPITFDIAPEKLPDLKPTQNSVAVYGRRIVVPNFNGIFTYAAPVPESALGVEAFDWDPAARRLKRAWLNKDLYIPNSMVAVSAPQGEAAIAYMIGLQDYETTEKPPRRRMRLRQPSGADAPLWTLEAVDLATGESLHSWPVGRGAEWNTYGSGVQIGPDREVFTSGAQGVYRLRPAAP